MFSGVRRFALVLAAVLLVASLNAQSSVAADAGGLEATAATGATRTSIAESAPSPAQPVNLTLDQSSPAVLSDPEGPADGVEENFILPVPLPPALLCLLTAFAGIALLGRRRAGIS
ncbi:hypothetical protein EOI86_23555 [Hwanghaeella grinnelliae]|uniref:VPLPA-CTERM sorting domain-containing protein n=1 Tax=Hwanghaeella grinnelliae TaxID=2500179 RepID=A0A437QHS8_9PROT|nr:hypothetical protein [Hwanghaeella grinnelliae]RVU34095.1 hypothetical protein EOI86_23555 [Hwanghaeella grinnelliae]